MTGPNTTLGTDAGRIRSRDLCHDVTGTNPPGLNDARVDAAQRQRAPARAVDELHGVGAETFDELTAARVRLRGDLDDRRAHRQLRARRQVLSAQIEIDVELVAGERPAIRSLGDQRHHARVGERELHVGVAPAVLGARTAAHTPRVADQSLDQIELGLGDDLADIDGRTPDNELDCPAITRARP